MTNIYIQYLQLQVRLGIQKKTSLFYLAESCVFYKKFFPKLALVTQVSSVNEAPDDLIPSENACLEIKCHGLGPTNQNTLKNPQNSCQIFRLPKLLANISD